MLGVAGRVFMPVAMLFCVCVCVHARLLNRKKKKKVVEKGISEVSLEIWFLILKEQLLFLSRRHLSVSRSHSPPSFG